MQEPSLDEKEKKQKDIEKIFEGLIFARKNFAHAFSQEQMAGIAQSVQGLEPQKLGQKAGWAGHFKKILKKIMHAKKYSGAKIAEGFEKNLLKALLEKSADELKLLNDFLKSSQKLENKKRELEGRYPKEKFGDLAGFLLRPAKRECYYERLVELEQMAFPLDGGQKKELLEFYKIFRNNARKNGGMEQGLQKLENKKIIVK